MTGIGMLTAEDQTAIEQRLTDFLSKCEAQWSALVDKGGISSPKRAIRAISI